MAEIKVFSTPTCPWCHKVKEFLKEKNLGFKDLDVSADEEARNELLDKSGQMGVPVVIIKNDAGDEKVIVGYREDEIREALRI